MIGPKPPRCVLICAPDPLSDELHRTLLWRENLERHLATRFGEAMIAAVAAKPSLIVIDRDFPQAARLVLDLRADPRTRVVSIAIVARGDLEARELELLGAGANAILRLPPTPEWDERLGRLLEVAVRRHTRIPVRLALGGSGGTGATGTILDLSASGLLLETEAQLRIGDDVAVRFRLPQSKTPVNGTARVVRLAGRQRYGAAFEGLDDDARRRLALFTGVA